MILYHYTDKNIKNKLKIKFFGNNYYTNNDKNISDVKRIFFYTINRPYEYLLSDTKYCYITKIKNKYIYDLKIDIKKLKYKYQGNINKLLKYIKKKYKGCIYNVGNYDIVILFKDIKILKKLKRRK